MLPKKIITLINELYKRTESKEIYWSYNDNDSLVSTELLKPDINIAISYKFDIIEEMGVYYIHIVEKKSDKELFFSTTGMYDDYKQVDLLYSSAQASEFDFSF